MSEALFLLDSKHLLTVVAFFQMKSIVQAVLSSMSGVGAVLGFALYPVARNPNLVWMYAALAAAIGLATVVFWLLFQKYNAEDVELNKRDFSNNGGGSIVTEESTNLRMG
jgi:POT family proton-dependent oligopeptide transporter